MQKTFTFRAVAVMLLFFLSIGAVYIAKPFLVPLVLACLFAMLFLPVCRWLEMKGWPRWAGALSSTLLLVGAIAGLIALIAWQVADVTSDMDHMQQYMQQTITQLQSRISSQLGISAARQQEWMKQQQAAGGSGFTDGAMTLLGGLSGLLVDSILMLVYCFLLLLLRTHLKRFVLQLVPADSKQQAATILHNSAGVSRAYLAGMGKMIVLLWIMYSIGFSIVGVKHAIFFGILCGLLEMIPFVGNLTGTGLTMIMVLTQDGGGSMLLGVAATYALVQFIQTYVLEPLVVGAAVKLNPLITIIAIVLGELIWGIPGMILALPLAGILKVLFDNVQNFAPFGFLMGPEAKKS